MARSSCRRARPSTFKARRLTSKVRSTADCALLAALPADESCSEQCSAMF